MGTVMITTPSSFGDHLRRFRKRKNLTQQRLADLIGVHRNTVSGWERGDYLPESRTTVLETAQQLGLAQDETRQLLEASLTALAPYWTVPFHRNPCFTGRAAILEALHSRLTTKQDGVLTRTSALSGLGGNGKTQVALEYAYRYALEYSAVFWLAAETTESLMASLHQLADQVQFPERHAAEQAQMIAAVQRWLASHADWLLIADNVEDLDLLWRVVPPTRQGALLLTTRRQALGPLAQVLDLPPMSSEEGVILLLRRARRFQDSVAGQTLPPESLRNTAIPPEAGELVTLLEGLPLALDQAGAYIEETGCSIADYLQRYRSQRKEVLARRGLHAGAHPAPVSTTVQLSLEQIERTHAAAADLLRVCAFLHPEAIPEDLFVRGATHLGPILGPVAADPYQFDLALATLRSASLLSRYSEKQTLSIHRLVQAILQDHIDESERRVWSERVVRTLHAVFPPVDFATWPQAERYLPHALACVPLIEAVGHTLPETPDLLSKVGSYLVERGHYTEAEPLLAQALALGEGLYGPNHPTLVPLLVRRIYLLWYQRQYEQVALLLQRALAIVEQRPEPDQIQMAELLGEFAILAWRCENYAEGEHLCQRALALAKQAAGADHPETLKLRYYLALLFRAQRQMDQAESAFQQTMIDQERVLGATHPQTIQTLASLATLYRQLGQPERAGPLFQRVLALRMQQLGPEHPDTATALTNLAAVYVMQGKFAEAEPLIQQALVISEQQLGPRFFPDDRELATKEPLKLQEGAEKPTRDPYVRALALFEHRLDAGHPQTQQLRRELAELLRLRH